MNWIVATLTPVSPKHSALPETTKQQTKPSTIFLLQSIIWLLDLTVGGKTVS